MEPGALSVMTSGTLTMLMLHVLNSDMDQVTIILCVHPSNFIILQPPVLHCLLDLVKELEILSLITLDVSALRPLCLTVLTMESVSITVLTLRTLLQFVEVHKPELCTKYFSRAKTIVLKQSC